MSFTNLPSAESIIICELIKIPLCSVLSADEECSQSVEENLWLHAECGCVISLSSFTVWALINGVVNWELRLGCCRRRAEYVTRLFFLNSFGRRYMRSGNWNYAVYSSTRSGKSPCMHGIPRQMLLFKTICYTRRHHTQHRTHQAEKNC